MKPRTLVLVLVVGLFMSGRDYLSPQLADQRKCASPDRPGLITCGTAIVRATMLGDGGILALAHLVTWLGPGRRREYAWVVSYRDVPDYPFGRCILIDEYISVNARTGDIQDVFGGGSGRCP